MSATTNATIETFRQVIRPRGEWLADVEQRLTALGWDYGDARALYSFESAHDQGMSPVEAADDFNEWVSA